MRDQVRMPTPAELESVNCEHGANASAEAERRKSRSKRPHAPSVEMQLPSMNSVVKSESSTCADNVSTIDKSKPPRTGATAIRNSSRPSPNARRGGGFEALASLILNFLCRQAGTQIGCSG